MWPNPQETAGQKKLLESCFVFYPLPLFIISVSNEQKRAEEPKLGPFNLTQPISNKFSGQKQSFKFDNKHMFKVWNIDTITKSMEVT